MVDNGSEVGFDFHGKRIALIDGDITQQIADVIVSSDDNLVSMGGGVSLAIRRAAGEVVWSESRRFVPAQLGSVVVTSAGNLHAQFVFHAIVIDFDNGQWPDVEIVRRATLSCLQEADRRNCQVLAMPALGTGAGDLASASAARSIIGAIFEHLEGPTRVQSIKLVMGRRDTLFDFMQQAIETKARAEYEPKLATLRAEKEKLVAKLQAQSPYSKLPFPIAVVRRLTDSHDNYHSRFTATVECAESVIKFFACLAMTDYLRLVPSAAPELVKFFRQPASLGSWKIQLDSSLKFLAGLPSSSVITRVRNVYAGKNQGYFAEFVRVRNEKLGHGATLPDQSYKSLFEALVGKLDHVLSELAFFEHYPLIVVNQTDITRNTFEYDTTVIMGDNAIFPKEKLSVASLRLERHTLYIYDREKQQALALHPFLIFETCPLCQIQETFFLEKGSDNGGTYHTYRANHRVQSDKYLDLVRLGLGEHP